MLHKIVDYSLFQISANLNMYRMHTVTDLNL